MKGKLIKGKNSGEYMINLEGVGYVTTYESTLPHKLSLKNCQAIEYGYNLNELAKEYSEKLWGEDSWNIGYASFKDGFQKCLEILGDKRFTERDMYIFGEYVWKYSENTHPIFDNPLGDKGVDEILEPKTEWDVEIEMEEKYGWDLHSNPPTKEFSHYEPKLDSDGRLILKRI